MLCSTVLGAWARGCAKQCSMAEAGRWDAARSLACLRASVPSERGQLQGAAWADALPGNAPLNAAPVDRVGCADWGPFAGPDRSTVEVREVGCSCDELRLRRSRYKSSQCEALAGMCW